MSILEDELNNDPLARGYSGMSDTQVLDSLNNTIDQNRNKTSMSGREVMDQVVGAESDLHQRHREQADPERGAQ